MDEEPKQPTIKLYFFWKSVEIGREQYKPAKALLEPQALNIAVEIPLTNELINNSAEILSEQLGGGNLNTLFPTLTEKGLSVVCKKLEEAMNLQSSEKPEEETSDDAWNDDTVSWDDINTNQGAIPTSNMTNEELHAKPEEEELNWEDDEENK